jgi:hypothetical protein
MLSGLLRRDVNRLWALLAFGCVEGNLLSFFKALVTALKRRMMYEQIRAAVFRRNEAKAFAVVEPLDCASCHLRIPSERAGRYSLMI